MPSAVCHGRDFKHQLLAGQRLANAIISRYFINFLSTEELYFVQIVLNTAGHPWIIG